MSHFTVLVMQKNLDEEGALEAALKPFHEFECTGDDDQYVQDVDKTAEAMAEYLDSKTKMVKLADGSLIDAYSDTFYRPATAEEVKMIEDGKEPDGFRYHRTFDKGGRIITVYQLPEGAEALDVPTSELKTAAEWISDYYGSKTVSSEDAIDTSDDHKYGYVLVDTSGALVRYIDRTNPNAEWDWWQLGGRWSGSLLAKPDATTAKRGSQSWASEPIAEVLRCDQIRKSDLDFDGMKKSAVEGRRAGWEHAFEKMKTKLEEPDLTEAEADRLRYEAFQIKEGLFERWKEEGSKGRFWDWISDKVDDKRVEKVIPIVFDYFDSSIDETGGYSNINAWIDDAPAISSYAALIDGEWIAKGEMGWFGMSSDNMSQKDWVVKLSEKIAELPDDYYLAMVDCHI